MDVNRLRQALTEIEGLVSITCIVHVRAGLRCEASDHMISSLRSLGLIFGPINDRHTRLAIAVTPPHTTTLEMLLLPDLHPLLDPF